MTNLGLVCSACFGLSCLSATAQAKSSRTFDYRFESIWSSTIRMLRVDRGYKLKDKDRENGFILFEFPGAGAVKKCPASLEIVGTVDEHGFRHQRVQIQIAHQPSYIEVNVLDGLERKLQEDHGDPPPAQRDEPPPRNSGKKGDSGKSDKPKPDAD